MAVEFETKDRTILAQRELIQQLNNDNVNLQFDRKKLLSFVSDLQQEIKLLLEPTETKAEKKESDDMPPVAPGVN